MLKWTEKMICSKCGKPFKHEFNDAVMPEDVEFRKHPLCKKCRCKLVLSSILLKK